MNKRKGREQARWAEQGLTFIELLVFIGVGSAMIVALMMMVTRTFTLSRQQLEQGAITEKARVQLERMSDEIRNAQYVDCNIDGDTADANEHWLHQADDFEIIVLSNVDDDVQAERLRYFVETGVTGEEGKLKRGVTKPGIDLCDWSGTENVRTVMDGLRNTDPDPDIPLFQYFTSGDDGAVLTTPVGGLSSVLRVRLDLHIEEAELADPGEVEVVTDVVPRGVKDPGACIQTDVKVTRYNYTSLSYGFADAAFTECKAYCLGSAVLGTGQCCPWSTSFSWQGNPNWYVWAACQCADTYLPPDIVPESINVNEYTAYVKECLEGTKCAGQKGEAICEAGCLDSPGQCVCLCQDGFPPTTACNDGFDNDGDGTADCSGCDGVIGLLADPGCSGEGDSSEWGTIQCDDGQENDCDGLIDFKISGVDDPDCTGPTDNDEGICPSPTCVPTELPMIPQCSDGIDNDCLGDGVDYAAGAGDPQCQNDNDRNEWSINKQCHDGIDNDNDGGIDDNGSPPDSACTGPSYESEFYVDLTPSPTP
jgi:hypothetical protein